MALPYAEVCGDVSPEVFADEDDPLVVELVLLLQGPVDGQVDVVGSDLEKSGGVLDVNLKRSSLRDVLSVFVLVVAETAALVVVDKEREKGERKKDEKLQKHKKTKMV